MHVPKGPGFSSMLKDGARVSKLPCCAGDLLHLSVLIDEIEIF